MKVLYVEDDRDSQDLVRKRLQVEEIEVYVANSGVLAIQMLKQADFDALILDIMMPGIDGFQVGRSARKEARNKDVPIILLTAHPRALREGEAKWLKPVASLTKPINFEKLIAVIRKVWRRQ
jgi:DNA-binding response OmpR family regulator